METNPLCCKHCGSSNYVKNGTVRGLQRYKCKQCQYNFVEGDRRVDPNTAKQKALAVLLYSLCKCSYGMIARILRVSKTIVYYWIRDEAAALPDPEIADTLQEVEFDEMWHFVGSKKTKFGSSRRWIAARGELSPGLRVIVMLQPLDDFTTNSST